MTYRTITRGAPRPILSEFRCPLHGVFEAVVDSGAEFAPCPASVALRIFRAAAPEGIGSDGPVGPVQPREGTCLKLSPWSPSKVPAMRMRRVEATRGRDDKPEHRGWLDTSHLEEGQDPEEFAADREKVHEELRKEEVMNLVRTDR